MDGRPQSEGGRSQVQTLRLFPTSRAILLCCLAAYPLLPSRAQQAHPSMSAADTVKLQQALDAYDAGQFGSAVPVLTELVRRYPKNFQACEALGSLLLETGKLQQALPYLQQAANLSPNDALAHANLGAAYLAQGTSDLALTQLQKAAQLDQSSPQTQSNLGRVWMLQNHPAEAATAFTAALNLLPGDPDIMYNQAVALTADKRPIEALVVINKIPANSVNDQVAELRGDLFEQTGDFKAALLEYQQGAKLNPSAPNLFALDVELLRHWTWEEALSVSRYSAQQFPQDARFPLASVIALFAKGDYQTAAVEASALLKANPDNNTYADLLGRSCQAAGEAAAPQCTQLETFAKAHPQNARIAVFAATAILERPVDHQDQVAAQQLLAKAALATPELPEAHYELAVLAQQNSNWEKSRTELEKAIALKPDYAEAHYRLSRAYAHLGRRDDAKRETELHQQYSDKQKDSLNARMQEVMLFLLKPS